MEARCMDDDITVVEDSEPELEPLRRQASEPRTRKGLIASTERQRYSSQLDIQTFPSDPADLQQRSVSKHPRPQMDEMALENNNQNGAGLITFSGSTCLVISSGSDEGINDPTTSKSHRFPLQTVTDVFHHVPSTPRPSISTDLSKDENNDHLNLSRFAYKNESKQITKHPRRRPPLQSTSVLSIANTNLGTKTSSRSHAYQVSPEFSDLDLSKLAKCVGCDVKWTIRKNAVQKLIHIKSCAKKRSLTIETVRILIMHEIENAPLPDVSAKGKGKGKEMETPKTFMAEVVDGATYKKRGKRTEVMRTVRPVNDIRESIMERARTVLDVTGSFSREECGSENLTQVFQPSKLASIMLMNKMPQDRLTGGEPSHQMRRDFISEHISQNPSNWNMGDGTLLPLHAHSSTGIGVQSTRRLERSRSRSPRSSDQITTSISIVSQLSPHTRESRLEGQRGLMDNPVLGSFGYSEQRTHVPTGILERGESPGITDDCQPEYDSFAWNDDAFLHFDPDKRMPPSIDHGRPSTEEELIQQLEQCHISTAGINNTCWSSQKPLHRKNYEIETKNDDLEKRIIDNILGNQDLHLRILRYEPTSFDVFLKFASEPAMDSPTLRIKLRSILDTLGINFYGAYSHWRTRR